MRGLILAVMLAVLPWPLAAAEAILVFTRTAGFRHDAIPVAVSTLRALAAERGLTVVHSEDSTVFTPERLAGFRAVVFANTTGEVLDDAQRAALRGYVNGGGGYLGLHAAADTEHGWPWYGELVGAWFQRHPPGLQRAQVTLHGGAEDGRQWWVLDEIYDYARNPRSDVQVLATIDEASYDGGRMGQDHPITWCRAIGRGRSWYTGFGHDAAVFADANVLALLRRGLAYATGDAPAC